MLRAYALSGHLHERGAGSKDAADGGKSAGDSWFSSTSCRRTLQIAGRDQVMLSCFGDVSASGPARFHGERCN